MRDFFEAAGAAAWEYDISVLTGRLLAATRSSEDDWATHLSGNPVAMRELLASVTVVDVNEKCAEIFGDVRGREALTHADANQFWPDESLPVLAEILRSNVKREPASVHRSVLKRLDGTHFPALIATGRPHEGQGGLSLTFAVLDLSAKGGASAERIAVERRYATLFNQVPVALFQVDTRRLSTLMRTMMEAGVTSLAAAFEADETLLSRMIATLYMSDANAAARAFLNLRPNDQLTDRRVTEFWTIPRETFRRAFLARWRGETGIHEEIDATLRFGDCRRVIFSVAFPPEFEGLRISLVSVLDISARNAAEMRAAQLGADLERADRVSLIGELALSIAHEVNQPLAAISANGSAAMRWLNHEQPNVDRARILLDRIVQDAERASGVIGGVRSLAAKAPLKGVPIDLLGLLREVVEFLGHELRRHEVDLVIQASTPSPWVIGEPVALQQVMTNLILNAAHALATSEMGTRTVIVYLKADREDAIIEVEDNGSGFSPEDAPKLFETLFTTKSGGMGMGLAIVRSIVERHSGTISAQSDGMNGSVFSARLPRVEAEHSASFVRPNSET